MAMLKRFKSVIILLCLMSVLFCGLSDGNAFNEAPYPGISRQADGGTSLWKKAALYLVLLACFVLAGTMAWRLYKEVAADETGQSGQVARKKAQEMLGALNSADRKNFESLRERCLRLQGITAEMKTDMMLSDISDTHASGVNRLLWIYLKLLFTKHKIEHFFQTVDVMAIRAQADRTRARLDAIESGTSESMPASKQHKSLKDIMETLAQRLKNYEMVRENHEFITLELERLYLKISSTLEMGIHRQSADAIIGEIDAVSESVAYAEQTIRELEMVIGFSLEEDEPPSLLTGADGCVLGGR